jgi:hypothetical protein
MIKYAARQPQVRISHIVTGTSTLMPAIDAAPSSDRAVARRRVNHRDTTAEPTTWPVVESPRATRTPYVIASCQMWVTRPVAAREMAKTKVPRTATGLAPQRSTSRPTKGMNTP